MKLLGNIEKRNCYLMGFQANTLKVHGNRVPLAIEKGN